MRKVLSLGLLAFALQGCILSGPMALLPPTAKYLLWNSDEKQDENNAQSISVQDLLKNARSFSAPTDKPAPLRISYDDYHLNDDRLTEIARFKEDTLDLVCGPYTHGTPLNAAMHALKTCGAIKAQLQKRGLKLNVRFNPDAAKGEAVLSPVMMIEAQDA